jgi:hypothetical protein
MDFSDLFYNGKSDGPGTRHVDPVHDSWTGRRGQEGGAAPWRRVGARACQCSPAVVDEDEAVPEGCPPEHEQQWRGGAAEAKNGGGLSSVRG